MSANSNAKSSSTSENPDFVLKHRIAGAGFLLFFGALFLPWLLGAPDEQSQLSAQVAVADEIEVSSEEIEEDLSSAIANEQVSEQEQVYISKITPLDNTPQSQDDGNDARPADTPGSITTPGSSGTANDSNSKQQPAKPAGKSPESTRQEASITAIEPGAKATDDTADQQSAKTQSVDVGWVVQVGVFTDKKGAARVVQDLQDKGFNPETTIVDTNRGKATGTRIWLGPYAQRVDAAKAKALLTSKTGEAGFIRAYP